MSICPHYDCNMRTDLGYCRITACCHPQYRYDSYPNDKCSCGYVFINAHYSYCPYCGRKRNAKKVYY